MARSPLWGAMVVSSLVLASCSREYWQQKHDPGYNIKTESRYHHQAYDEGIEAWHAQLEGTGPWALLKNKKDKEPLIGGFQQLVRYSPELQLVGVKKANKWGLYGRGGIVISIEHATQAETFAQLYERLRTDLAAARNDRQVEAAEAIGGNLLALLLSSPDNWKSAVDKDAAAKKIVGDLIPMGSGVFARVADRAVNLANPESVQRLLAIVDAPLREATRTMLARVQRRREALIAVTTKLGGMSRTEVPPFVEKLYRDLLSTEPLDARDAATRADVIDTIAEMAERDMGRERHGRVVAKLSEYQRGQVTEHMSSASADWVRELVRRRAARNSSNPSPRDRRIGAASWAGVAYTTPLSPPLHELVPAKQDGRDFEIAADGSTRPLRAVHAECVALFLKLNQAEDRSGKAVQAGSCAVLSFRRLSAMGSANAKSIEVQNRFLRANGELSAKTYAWKSTTGDDPSSSSSSGSRPSGKSNVVKESERRRKATMERIRQWNIDRRTYGR